jgi:copper resistance protein B
MKRIAMVALLSGAAGMPAVAQDPHAGHTAPTPEPVREAATAADLAVGNAAPPAVILDSAVDHYYGAGPMDRARDVLASEHGGGLISKVMANIFEYAAVDAGSGYRWDLEAWYGGDMHRLVFKTEGEGVEGDGAELVEIQALYSRAVGRYTDLQAGLRYDFEPDGRAYATVSVESLLPYWFDVEAALFLSDRGDAFARLEASHDLRFTQRLIPQPRIELEIAAQDVPDSRIGSGVSSAELGLRLRYDIRREFAPYIGVNFEKSFGQTADFARAAGGDDEETSFVAGLRAWF